MAGRRGGHRRPSGEATRPRSTVPRRAHGGLLRPSRAHQPPLSDRRLPRKSRTLPNGPAHPLGPNQARLADVAWAAGLFDGEGSINIGSSPNRNGDYRYYAILKVDMVGGGERTIQRLRSIFGGSIQTYHRSESTVWRWRIAGKACGEIAQALLTHATTKKEELGVLLRFLATKPTGAYTPRDRARCQALKQELEFGRRRKA